MRMKLIEKYRVDAYKHGIKKAKGQKQQVLADIIGVSKKSLQNFFKKYPDIKKLYLESVELNGRIEKWTQRY